MIKNAKGQKQFLLYGTMAVILGFGDLFHLIPRSIALLTTGLENHAAALGIGKWITSVTMTVFYVLLYWVLSLSRCFEQTCTLQSDGRNAEKATDF